MKRLPLSESELRNMCDQFPTPFHFYDERGITETAKDLITTFDWAPGFKNYFAVKALPNPHILRILTSLGMGLDCSSLAELVLAEKIGVYGENVMFTSNNTSATEYQKAYDIGAIINIDDITHIPFLEDTLMRLPETLSFRFNPGTEREGNRLIGVPSEAKFGMTRAQLFDAYKICLEKGVVHFGLHTMVASNELNPDYFLETARMLFDIAVKLKHELGIELDFINMGGGFGIPYEPDTPPLDIGAISGQVNVLYENTLRTQGITPRIFYECGRYVTGPHGYLISTIRHKKKTYREYIGLDASMADLMRPGMYGAYHYISVLGKEHMPATRTYDVTGSLCENNDKFAVQRTLPHISIGDIVAIHDTGAHGHSMGFNYNGQLRSAELLRRNNGDVKQIRRAETLEDYFATLNFQDFE